LERLGPLEQFKMVKGFYWFQMFQMN